MILLIANTAALALSFFYCQVFNFPFSSKAFFGMFQSLRASRSEVAGVLVVLGIRPLGALSFVVAARCQHVLHVQSS